MSGKNIIQFSLAAAVLILVLANSGSNFFSYSFAQLTGSIQELPRGRIPGVGNAMFPGGLSSLAYTSSTCSSGWVAVGAGVYPADLPYGDAKIVGIDCQELANAQFAGSIQRYPGQSYHLNAYTDRNGLCPSGSVLVGVEVYDPMPDDTDQHDFAIYCRQVANAQFTGPISDVPGGLCALGSVVIGAAFYDPFPGDDTDNRQFAIHCQQVVVTPQNQPPQGAFEGTVAPTCRAFGWATDPDGGNPIQVHIYADGPTGQGGTIAGAGPAQTSNRQCGGTFCGFDIPLNGQFFQTPHQLFAYAIDGQGGPSRLLSGSPQSLICQESCVQTVSPWSACSGGTQQRFVTQVNCTQTVETRSCTTALPNLLPRNISVQ